jgi:ATP/maltotriose-dependent transcriptional regulator MalT
VGENLPPPHVLKMMSSKPLSFNQAKELLDSLAPGSPYRLVVITCQQPDLRSQLIAAWQAQAGLQIVRLSALIQEFHGEEALDYQVIAIQKLNHIAESKDHLALVLEDLDQFEDRVVQSFADWLANYLPPNLTVVLAGAQAPPFSLSRLRVRRTLLEINLLAA